MNQKSKTRCIGILTSGGDCPGLNAAIRGVVKAAINVYGMRVIGFLDGFRGLAENRFIPLDDHAVSGILTLGGTILGTSRDKPHKMHMGNDVLDMTGPAVQNAKRMGVDCLVCLGGNGTQKNACHLSKAGLPVLTLPKTIDNDVVETDTTFGYDTALTIATEAIDRLHTTATSHHRMIVCEIMGHSAGWLALGSGIAGGSDVILIPEIPYDLTAVVAHLVERRRSGKRFSIIAVSEGALSIDEAKARDREEKRKKEEKVKKTKTDSKLTSTQSAKVDVHVNHADDDMHLVQEPKASRLGRQIQQVTGIEVRVTSLGHVQRGGGPTSTDRLLCTRLGTKAAELLAQGEYNVMVGIKGDTCVAVPLDKVAGLVKRVPLNHPWIKAARLVGTCIGDHLEG